MKRYEFSKTETFIHDDFFVDIVSTGKDYEAWLYKKDYSLKMLMFGMPEAQQSYNVFLEIVANSLSTKEYQEIYNIEYCD